MLSFKELLAERQRNINLISIDIQPHYVRSQYGDFMERYVKFLNENDFKYVLYLFNGEEHTSDSYSSILYWLEEWGVDKDKLKLFDFYDKGYAFFRGWMDNGISDELIVKVGKWMIRNKMRDSREFEEDVIRTFDKDHELDDIYDSIYIPEVAEELKKVSKPLLVGGGRHECFAEIELLMQMLNKRYKTHRKFIY